MTSGATWKSHFASIIIDLDIILYQVDSDVWMQPAEWNQVIVLYMPSSYTCSRQKDIILNSYIKVIMGPWFSYFHTFINTSSPNFLWMIIIVPEQWDQHWVERENSTESGDVRVSL